MILIAEDIIREHLLTCIWAWLNGRCQFIYRQSLLTSLRNKKINSIVCSPDPLVTDTRFFFLDFFHLKKHWKNKSYSFFTISTFSYQIRYTIVNITTIGHIKYFILVKFERHVKKISKGLQVSVITV